MKKREEARRKKYGYNRKQYDPAMPPWLIRVGGKKDGKHYKGQREGGVSENTTFYVFTHAPDGSFEAQPIKEWYNFVPRVSLLHDFRILIFFLSLYFLEEVVFILRIYYSPYVSLESW